MWFALLFFFALPMATAEIIDRVAVVVGAGVITESEILREIRLTAYLNGDAPDFSAASKKKTAERLVEQRLMQAEINQSPYPLPGGDAIIQMLKSIQSRYSSAVLYQQSLQKYDITEEELKERLQRQLTTVRFIDFRFKPGIQVSDDDTAKYFREKILPQLRKDHPESDFVLDDYREESEQAVIGDRADRASDAWLKLARERTKIEYRDDAFRPEPERQEAGR